MNTPPTTTPLDFDSRAEAIARGTEPLADIDMSYLMHAARYGGPGWSQSRRSEIVRFIRRELVND